MGRHALQKEQKSLNKNDTRAQVRHLYIVQQLKILQLYGHNIDLTENICTKKKPECNWHHRLNSLLCAKTVIQLLHLNRQNCYTAHAL